MSFILSTAATKALLDVTQSMLPTLGSKAAVQGFDSVRYDVKGGQDGIVCYGLTGNREALISDLKKGTDQRAAQGQQKAKKTSLGMKSSWTACNPRAFQVSAGAQRIAKKEGELTQSKNPLYAALAARKKELTELPTQKIFRLEELLPKAAQQAEGKGQAGPTLAYNGGNAAPRPPIDMTQHLAIEPKPQPQLQTRAQMKGMTPQRVAAAPMRSPPHQMFAMMGMAMAPAPV